MVYAPEITFLFVNFEVNRDSTQFLVYDNIVSVKLIFPFFLIFKSIRNISYKMSRVQSSCQTVLEK